MSATVATNIEQAARAYIQACNDGDGRDNRRMLLL
jgi:hypothetical protein